MRTKITPDGNIEHEGLNRVEAMTFEQQYPLRDEKVTLPRLQTLHPKVRDTFRMFVSLCEQKHDITIRVTQALRTIEYQNELYAQGRTKAGKIVTNAKGGSSYHNYGLAIDMVPIINNKAAWGYPFENFKTIAGLLGIEWGGNWKFVDKPHFQITFGYKTKQLLTMPKDADGYVILP